jgi:hypothetical protein
MPQFEVFHKWSAPVTKTPTVTIQVRGMVSLSRPAYDMLGEPKAVELLFDRTERVMGLRAVDPSADDSYPVRPGKSRAGSTFYVSATAFCKFYDIETLSARRYVATLLDDAILCVDLRQSPLEVSSNRAGTGRLPGSGVSSRADSTPDEEVTP